MCRTLKSFTLIIVLMVLSSSHANAFDGFGSGVTGGSGGSVIMVTNLNNSGTGSLRAALNGSNRIVRFSVSGTISLSSSIEISGTNITVDGFSAPPPGITITSSSDGFVISGNPNGPDSKGSNIVIQGLKIRDSAGDSFQIAYNAHDVVIDHNSISGAGDGAVDVTEGAYNVTISYNILANTRGTGPCLLAFDSSRVSYHHNIYYNNYDRNPIPSASNSRAYSSGPVHTDPLADIRYNVIYKYSIGTYIMSEGGSVGTGNIVSNLYKNNGAGNPSNTSQRGSYDHTTRAHAYIAGNVSVQDCRGQAYNYDGSPNGIPDSDFNMTGANSANDRSSQYPAPQITGPSRCNKQALINEWTSVKTGAGVIAYFPDDSTDSAVRAGITIPSISIFDQPWNTDATSGCSPAAQPNPPVIEGII